MVSNPKDFPRIPSKAEELEATIDRNLERRKDSGRLQFVVTTQKALLDEVLTKYRDMGWQVEVERKKRLSAYTSNYMLKFWPS